MFEPFSGHGVLLASAMLRLGEDLDSSFPPAKRHEYFRKRLTGVEKDPFALEVCRLLLTLTDYPNHNNWDLHHDDVFSWEGWEQTMDSCDVVLSNPPYEAFKKEDKAAIGATKPNAPAEFLKRALKAPPAMLGVILPQSFLSSPFYREANRSIARHYGEVSIVELPKLFRYADNETIALLAHGRREMGEKVSVHYSEVLKGSEEEFLNDWKVSFARTQLLDVPTASQRISMRLVREGSVFDPLSSSTQLGDLCTVRKGVNWTARTDGRKQSEPRMDVASDRLKRGFIKGVEKMRGNLTQNAISRTRYLSILDKHQDPSTRAHKHPWTERKVACNAARFERHSPWRIAAYADSEGLAFTKQFFAIWPNDGVSEYAISAILNSPIGNAFSFLP